MAVHRILLLLFSVSVATINAHPCAHIKGGTIAPEAAYRYQVSIRSNGTHICSGSIIDQRHILTSRYCVGSILVKDLSIIAGTNSLKEGGVIYTAKKIILHENLSQDIALIRTTEDINFDSRIEPIAITDKDYRDDGTPILITGWGSLLDGTLLTELLQEVHIRLFDQDQCVKRYGDIGESKFCTIEKCGTHLCQIDIGSPLVVHNVLIGIKSLGYNCGLDRADIHVRIYHFIDWIEINTKIEPDPTTTTSAPVTEECF
ncbi:hypothetical protein PV326_001159 [Microctonus aethiopoides]|nr:hypothetical protein PV326_001159 [Microctonus aethiopoides]